MNRRGVCLLIFFSTCIWFAKCWKSLDNFHFSSFESVKSLPCRLIQRNSDTVQNLHFPLFQKWNFQRTPTRCCSRTRTNWWRWWIRLPETSTRRSTSRWISWRTNRKRTRNESWARNGSCSHGLDPTSRDRSESTWRERHPRSTWSASTWPSTAWTWSRNRLKDL